MKTAPAAWAVILGLSAACNLWWFAGVRVDGAAPAPGRPAAGPVVLGRPDPARVRPERIFALPGGDGFSRYLARDAAPAANPRLDFTDTPLTVPRGAGSVSNAFVLARLKDFSGPWLDQLPPPPELNGHAPAPARPALWVEAPPGWQVPEAWTGDLLRLAPAAWSLSARLELSDTGAVEHVLIDDAEGAGAELVRAVVDRMRRLTPPAGTAFGRSVRFRLAHRPPPETP